MKKDLTASNLHRQNILNNKLAISHIEQQFNFGGLQYDGETVFTKKQIADSLEVEERTIDNYLIKHKDELLKNGYSILKGKNLADFKLIADVDEMNFVDIKKAPSLGIFTFKTLLNIAMLLVESDKARQIRSRILDIVMSVIANKVGDKTYINQRDVDYLPSAFQEENYRTEFTNAISNYIDEKGNWKFGKYTNMIYKAIFAENAQEYRQILKLEKKHSTRETFYSEILDLITAFEAGFAEQLTKESKKLQRKLKSNEADDLFDEFASQALFKPMVLKARTIMASRDYSLRDAIHDKLEAYIQAMPESDYEKFLGDKSKDLSKHIEDSLEVYKRLKDR